MHLRLLVVRAVVAVPVIGLCGCAGTSPETTATQCETSWQAAAEESDSERAHDRMHESFSACSSYEQWRQVGERFPDELLEGFTPEGFVDVGCTESDLVDSAVCTTRG